MDTVLDEHYAVKSNGDLSNFGSTLTILSRNGSNGGNHENNNNKEAELRKVKFRSWKNALALSVGWLLLYTGYFPMSSIQSSLNDGEGIGTISLSVMNAMEMIGNMFLSNLIIYRIGNKWSISIGALFFTAYIGANFYPCWATLTPTAGLAGIGASLTWIAQNTYLTKLSQYYAANYVDSDYNTINIRFFGTFYAIYYSSNIVGNIASSFLLGVTEHKSENETLGYDPAVLCGYDYCNQDLGTSFKPPDDFFEGLLSNTTKAVSSHRTDPSRVYALCLFCLGSTLASALIMTLLVDPLPKLNISEETESNVWKQMGATFRHLTNPNQLLLLPLTFYNGLDNDFLYTEFTKSFVTCPYGIEYIGLVAACYGVMGPTTSLISGWISTKRTRALPFVIAAAAHISCCIIMLNWKPGPGKEPVYAISSLWGIGSGVWCSQLNAYYGIIFPNDLEASFANFHLWNSLGSMILYGASHVTCTLIKLYVMIGVLTVGLAGYVTVVIRRHYAIIERKKTEMATAANKGVVVLTNLNSADFNAY